MAIRKTSCPQDLTAIRRWRVVGAQGLRREGEYAKRQRHAPPFRGGQINASVCLVDAHRSRVSGGNTLQPGRGATASASAGGGDPIFLLRVLTRSGATIYQEPDVTTGIVAANLPGLHAYY